MLLLAQKYCVTSLEAHARSVAITLTHPEVIWENMTSTLMDAERVLQIGYETGTEAIAELAVGAIISESPPLFETGEPPHYSLPLPELADRFCAPWPHLAVLLYYNVMCKGPDVWGEDQQLSLAQKATLGIGAARCTYAFDGFIRDLPDTMARITCTCGDDDYLSSVFVPYCGDVLIPHLLSLSAYSQRSSCDILGRLGEISSPWTNTRPMPACHPSFVGRIKAQLEVERARLARHFQLIPEAAPVPVDDIEG